MPFNVILKCVTFVIFNNSVYMTFSNLLVLFFSNLLWLSLVLFIIQWFVVFGRVQQSEINRGCFFINGSYYWYCWKIISENCKTSIFFIYWFYIYFVRAFIPVDFIDFLSIMILSIWSCKKYFVILYYCSILVIFLNMPFVSARWFHK